MAFLGSICTSDLTSSPLARAVSSAPIDLPLDAEALAQQKAANEAAIARLEEDGFAGYVASSDNVADLATRALAGTIARSELVPQDIDAVIFSTESFWDRPDGHEEDPARHFALRNRLVQSLDGLGLKHAVPYGNWMSASGNFGPTLALAHAAVTSGQHDAVLLVAADRIHPRLPRLMHNNAAVVSDIAASCLISADRGDYRIDSVQVVSAPKLATFNLEDRKDLGKIVVETMRALLKLKQRFETATGRSPADYDLVLTGHFHRLSLQAITDTLGIRPAAIRRDGGIHASHAYASDNLLTLDSLARAGELPLGRDLLLLSTGVWTWSLIALTVTTTPVVEERLTLGS